MKERIGRQFHERRTRRWWYGGATCLVAIFFAVFFVAASGAVSGSPSGFESSDGNMVLNNKDGSHTDWNCFDGSANSGFLSSPAADAKCKVTSGGKDVSADPNGEVQWVPGQKFDTECPALNTGNNPPKDEFVNVASYSETASNLDVYFYGATIRSTANGNSSGDVELNQSSGDDVTTAGCRTAGDRLIAYDFLNGGTGIDFHVLTWITPSNTTVGNNNGTCLIKQNVPPCWGANVLHPTNSSDFDGASNSTATIAAADNGINGQLLAVNQFAEFGVNLSAILGLRGQCISFPQQVWESRSSGSSFTSNPQDIEFEHQQIQNCGTITIIKETIPAGINQNFGYNNGIDNSGDFTLNDGGTDTKTFSNVVAGSYTVSEKAEPAGFAFDSVSCTVTGGSSTSSGTDDASHIGVKNLTLTGGGSITCTYKNKQQLGAIKLSKISSKAAATALTGAHVRICTNGTDGGTFSSCTAAASGSDDLTITNSDGTICVDNLGFGDYYVSEKTAPTGYAIDDAKVHKVTVNTNAKCSDSTYVGQSFQFKDTPLTNLTVNVASQVSGGTQSSISCVDSASGAIGNSPEPDSGRGDPETVSATGSNGLKPGIYTCTIDIDP